MQSDNLSSVNVINKGSCRDIVAIHLLYCEGHVVSCGLLQHWLCGYISTSQKNTTLLQTKLCRNKTDQMFLSHLGLSGLPMPLPSTILLMISPKGLYWQFYKLLKETLLLVNRVTKSTSTQPQLINVRCIQIGKRLNFVITWDYMSLHAITT